MSSPAGARVESRTDVCSRFATTALRKAYFGLNVVPKECQSLMLRLEVKYIVLKNSGTG